MSCRGATALPRSISAGQGQQMGWRHACSTSCALPRMGMHLWPMAATLACTATLGQIVQVSVSAPCQSARFFSQSRTSIQTDVYLRPYLWSSCGFLYVSSALATSKLYVVLYLLRTGAFWT